MHPLQALKFSPWRKRHSSMVASQFKRMTEETKLERGAHLAKGLEVLKRVLLAIPNSNMSKCTTTKHCIFVLDCDAI